MWFWSASFLPCGLDSRRDFARKKRGVGAPIAIGAGLLTGIGTGAGVMGLSASTYYQLSAQLNNDMDKVADLLTTLQQQINSLAEVVLQNTSL